MGPTMFTKIACIAALAVVATAEPATFADESFLGGEEMFKEAEARRAVYVAEHLKLVKARFDTAHTYFAAKDKEATAMLLRARWTKAWNASVKVHEKAIADHKLTVKQLEAAVARELKAVKHHKITVAALATANKHRTAALAAWKKA